MVPNVHGVHVPAWATRLDWMVAGPNRPQLLGAGGHTVAPGRSMNWIRPDTWQMTFILGGRMDINIGCGWQRFEAYSAVLFAPGAAYRERLPAGCSECNLFALFFDACGYQPLQRRFNSTHRMRRINDPVGVVRQLITNIEQAMAQSTGSDLMIDGCFGQLIAILVRSPLRNTEIAAQDTCSTESDLVARAHRFMRRRLSEPIRLVDIALHLGMSSSGFSHAYSRATGSSPIAALRAMRIEAAKTLLLRGRASLQAIAEETGFSDAFHLSRVFKQLVGRSPSAFRRSSDR